MPAQPLSMSRMAQRRPLNFTMLLWAGVLCAALWSSAALANTTDTPRHSVAPRSVEDQAHDWARRGYSHPDLALDALDQLASEAQTKDISQRGVLHVRGIVLAMAGREAAALALADQLRDLRPDLHGPLGPADSGLVKAVLFESLGQSKRAAEEAHGALDIYLANCPLRTYEGSVTNREAMPPPAELQTICDPGAVWMTLSILQRRATSMGLQTMAKRHNEQALHWAVLLEDPYYRARSLADLAYLHAREAKWTEAQRALTQARRLAPTHDGDIQAVLHNTDAVIANMQGMVHQAVDLLKQGVRAAEASEDIRWVARLRVNLSDIYAKTGKPREALKEVELALPVLQRYNDGRLSRILLTNAALAKVHLGRLNEAKADIDAILRQLDNEASVAHQITVMTEFGEALAKVGDHAGALQMFKRERELSKEVAKQDRAAALQEMQLRFEADAQKRQLRLLEKDKALQAQTQANDVLQWRLAALVGLVLLLGLGLLTQLINRVRAVQRHLRRQQARLRHLSERDPLTQLLNRRHFNARMKERGRGEDWPMSGTLLMLDVDHFKQINDQHGHAAGDAVLIEIAKRLSSVVRDRDMVVRWGGEEFLLLAPQTTAAQAHQLAQRLLQIIGSKPFSIEQGLSAGMAMSLTASIGYARFPLPPHETPIPRKQALNLIDMALYTAKSLGRNRAVGIVSAQAEQPDDVRQIEAKFDQAVREGRVVLKITRGTDA